MNATWVGQALLRKEDGPLLTGRDRFLDDLPQHGVAHVAILSSPHAHARIRSIDVSRAEAEPSVFAVLTGDEVVRISSPQRGRIPLPVSPRVYALAHDTVVYVGQPVAAVAATDRAVAEDALDLIEVDYEPLPAVVSPEAAMAPEAPI